MGGKAEQFGHLQAATLSDVGRKRKNNEDAHGEFPSFGVWCVADGMGGGDDGEVASAAVVKSLDATFSALPERTGGAYSAQDLSREMSRALDGASAWIYARAREKSLKGCGSTFVGVVFDPTDPGTALALHVGDSRLYRLRGRDLKQITKDHSVAEMMGTKDEKDLNPMFRGMILRAVGVEKTVDVETTPFAVREDDVIVICSDGLTRMVPDGEIARIVRDAAGDLPDAVRRLVEAANDAGGIDNVTVTLVRVGHLPAPIAAIPIPSVGESLSNSGFGTGTPSTRTTDAEDGAQPSPPRSKSPLFWFLLGLVVASLVAGLAVWLVAPGIRGRVVGERTSPAGRPSERQAAAPEAPDVPELLPSTGVATSETAVVTAETNALALLESSLTNDVTDVTNAAPAAESSPAGSAAGADGAKPDDAEAAAMAAELKAERARREQDEAKAAERDRERRAAALEFGRFYRRDDFADFGVFVDRALARGASADLLKKGKRLSECKEDADATEHARVLAAEVIDIAGRLETALRSKGACGKVSRNLTAACAALAGRDPADAQTQRDCMALMHAVSEGLKGARGRR